jgi:phosphatidylglycerol:prolipoprotein diacylglycerol transferase
VHLPLYLHVGPWTLHAHTVFELLAYFVGFRLYLRQRRSRGDVIGGYERWWLVAAAIAGGAIGSRGLAWAESPALTLDHLRDSGYLLGGKTVVGGLLGGTIAVEAAKRALGVARRTGDLFAVPLAVGISIGRIGCFFEGPGDQTWGGPTNLPWGVDPGDGLARHPSPLYEAAFLLMIAVLLSRLAKKSHPDGWLFRVFMTAYLGFRLLTDAIKPEPALALGLGAIQWASVAGLVYYTVVWRPVALPDSRTAAESH